jgi:hypothetical protein
MAKGIYDCTFLGLRPAIILSTGPLSCCQPDPSTAQQNIHVFPTTTRRKLHPQGDLWSSVTTDTPDQPRVVEIVHYTAGDAVGAHSLRLLNGELFGSRPGKQLPFLFGMSELCDVQEDIQKIVVQPC